MNKYIIARIELPLEIFPDGKYETCEEHISIDFVKCDKLPPKNDLTGIDLSKILEKMDFININKPTTTILPQDTLPQDTLPEATIHKPKEYIPKEMVSLKKKREHSKNSTFKNKSHLNNRFSLKNI
jgi:hypothetical protein